jgi:hypothetical protein
MVDPSPHPQNMNVLKHHGYVWSGCGNHSMRIGNLNHCSMTSYVAQVWPVNFAISTKLRWMIMVEEAWWWIHLPIHSIWMLSNTLNMFGVELIQLHVGLGPIWKHHDIICSPGVTHEFRQLPKLQLHKMVEEAWWWIHLLIHSIWMLSNTLICLEWMWESFHVDREPQSMQYDIIWSPGVTHKFCHLN